jgi:putative NADPH-quinone reductase
MDYNVDSDHTIADLVPEPSGPWPGVFEMNVLIVFAHPRLESYGAALADQYQAGAIAAGATVRRINVAEMQFDALADPRSLRGQEEADVLAAQESLTWADHVVFVYPTWWGTYPPLLQGFIDRVFTPGVAYDFSEKPESDLPTKLLKGRTGSLVVTMDSPTWWHRWIYGDPSRKALARAVFWYTGIKCVGEHVAERIRHLSDAQRENTLHRMFQTAHDEIHRLRPRLRRPSMPARS